MRPRSRTYLSVLLVLLPIMAGLGFIILSISTFRAGYPLDDAWIHQTYARNLATSGHWEYIPGNPSAGSTSPFWTGLIAVGYVLKLNPMLWTMGAGLLCQVVLIIIGWRILSQSQELGHHPWLLVCAICGLILEWHLAWASVSGMETTLYAAISLLVYWNCLKGRVFHWSTGIFVGIAIWTRPDGILLLIPVIFSLFSGKNKRLAPGSVLPVLLFTVSLAGLMIFNYTLSGNVLPNTFYAKQIEYSGIYSQSFLLRFVKEFAIPLTGGGLVLLPGFILAIIRSIHGKDWFKIGAWLWVMVFIAIYALRLPVTYQHGRYIIPVVPIFFIMGIEGWVSVFERIRIWSSRYYNLSRTAFLVCFGLISIGFSILGGIAYSKDVAIIESEMVDTAIWIEKNTDPGALIGAHDIGALGYFGNRRILDLAGLINPEVIPFMIEEDRLAEYLSNNRAGYLVTFPGWYPQLTKTGVKLYEGKEAFSIKAGGEHMTVYRWISR